VIEALSAHGSDKSLDDAVGVSRRLHRERAMRLKRSESHIPSIRCAAASSN
jgi:hypothetical protein